VPAGAVVVARDLAWGAGCDAGEGWVLAKSIILFQIVKKVKSQLIQDKNAQK